MAVLLCLLCSCSGERELETNMKDVSVKITLDIPYTKGGEVLTARDVSIIVFSQEGLAERCEAIDGNGESVEMDLIGGRRYSFYAFANFGYHVFADHISEMAELTFHSGSPASLAGSPPMCGKAEDLAITEDGEIHISLERLTAEVRVVMDRSMIADDVTMEVTGIRIGNAPNSVRVSGPSRISGPGELLKNGFSLIGADVEALNRTASDGRSGEVVLYLLENMQGDIRDFEVESDADKTFDDGDPRRETCSYLELEFDYLSWTHFTGGGPLIYRTYLGKDAGNLDVQRNCRYSIAICPEGDGLNGDGWRVDKTWLQEFGPSRFASFPESYIRGNIGDTLHLWCEFYPPHAEFDVGLDELEYDKAHGIYDYIVDEDGHGVRLILKGAGVGLVYMKAGDPVNESALWVVEVNLPDTEPRAIDISQYMNQDTTSAAPEFLRRQDDHLRFRLRDRGLSPSLPNGSHPDYAQPRQWNVPWTTGHQRP